MVYRERRHNGAFLCAVIRVFLRARSHQQFVESTRRKQRVKSKRLNQQATCYPCLQRLQVVLMMYMGVEDFHADFGALHRTVPRVAASDVKES